MDYSRRKFLAATAAASVIPVAGCVSPYGHKASYTTQILEPQHQNTVFHWTDLALQSVRNQRILTPVPRTAMA